MSPLDDESGGLIFIVVLCSVKVALKVRQGGSETAAVRGAVLSPWECGSKCGAVRF